MCTLVILRRPGHGWPVVLAANRDEMADRRWRPPGRHWPDRPEIVGGHDALAGGTWLGLNDQGVAAGIMNRRATLGPEAGKRSRGELVLEALDHADADAAAVALADLDGTAYRPFNMANRRAPRSSTRRNTDRRLAPSARRTPSSFERWATVKDMTP